MRSVTSSFSTERDAHYEASYGSTRQHPVVCVTWRMLTRSYVWQHSCIWEKWHICMCDMTHSQVWHDSFLSVTCLSFVPQCGKPPYGCLSLPVAFGTRAIQFLAYFQKKIEKMKHPMCPRHSLHTHIYIFMYIQLIVCLCIFVYTYLYLYMYIHVYIYLHTYVYTYMYKFIYVDIYTHIYVCTYI